VVEMKGGQGTLEWAGPKKYSRGEGGDFCREPSKDAADAIGLITHEAKLES